MRGVLTKMARYNIWAHRKYFSHLQNPLGKLTSILLGVMFDIRDPLKDVATVALLHDEAEAIGRLEEIQQRHDIFVTETP